MKKYIISGGPSSGKTSLCNELKGRGYAVFGEVATRLLEKGRPKDWKKFSYQVFEEQIKLEKQNQDKDIVFFDRSLVDSVAYMVYYKICLPKSCKQKIKDAGYTKVFFLEMLPDEMYHRKLPIDKAREIYKVTKKVYKDLGIPLVEVPILESVKARADFVIKNIKK